jgi:hypothetical protein
VVTTIGNRSTGYGNRTAQGTAQGRRLRRPQRIAALLGFYGIVVIIMGLVADSAQDRARTGDLNANLWAGIAMAVVATGLAVWSRLRPVIMESPDGR